jgi:hypothetical protein
MTREPPLRGVLDDAQRAGLLGGLDLHGLEALVLDLFGERLDELGSTHLEEVLGSFYGPEGTGDPDADRVLVLPLYEDWAAEAPETGRDEFLAALGAALAAFTGVEGSDEIVARGAVLDDPEAAHPSEIDPLLRDSFGKPLGARGGAHLYSLPSNHHVVLVLRDPSAFASVVSDLQHAGAVELLSGAHDLSA